MGGRASGEEMQGGRLGGLVMGTRGVMAHLSPDWAGRGGGVEPDSLAERNQIFEALIMAAVMLYSSAAGLGGLIMAR